MPDPLERRAKRLPIDRWRHGPEAIALRPSWHFVSNAGDGLIQAKPEQRQPGRRGPHRQVEGRAGFVADEAYGVESAVAREALDIRQGRPHLCRRIRAQDDRRVRPLTPSAIVLAQTR